MKITEVRTYSPVYKVKDPFSNALRTTRERAFGIVEVITDSGITGWGEGATVPAKRFGQPDEFGAACAFLCSAHAGYITGQNLLMDGGVFPGAF